MKRCIACKLDQPDSAAECPVCAGTLTDLSLETADNPKFEQSRSIMNVFLPKCWNLVGGLTWGLGIIAAIWLGFVPDYSGQISFNPLVFVGWLIVFFLSGLVCFSIYYALKKLGNIAGRQ